MNTNITYKISLGCLNPETAEKVFRLSTANTTKLISDTVEPLRFTARCIRYGGSSCTRDFLGVTLELLTDKLELWYKANRLGDSILANAYWLEIFEHLTTITESSNFVGLSFVQEPSNASYSLSVEEARSCDSLTHAILGSADTKMLLTLVV